MSLLDWKEKWMGLYGTNHFADKEECACKQDFRKIQKKYRSIYINGFWVLKRKITYYSLCQREAAGSRGHEWLRQRGEEVSHNELSFINFWAIQYSSYQPEGWDVHGGQSPSFYLKSISTYGYCPLKDAKKRAQNICKQHGRCSICWSTEEEVGWVWGMMVGVFERMEYVWGSELTRWYGDNRGDFSRNYSQEK